MSADEFERLQLLADIEAFWTELRQWGTDVPEWDHDRWRPAEACRVLTGRLEARTDALRVRIEAPLVVATLGGTGTGKSTLVNALVGAPVTAAGRQRPTTRRPVLVSRPDVTPELLGIAPVSVDWVPREMPELRDLVLLDSPDPDTADDGADPTSNTAVLRALLPHCDVLLVVTTQQKYRSARVSSELAAAASGARLVFVQTHADTDDDIRSDWSALLGDDYAIGEMFFVDSVAALADVERGIAPRGEFGRLRQFLARQLSGAAGARIRRANFLDLVEQTLEACTARVDENAAVFAQLEAAIHEQRARFAAFLAEELRSELSEHRQAWEQRLLAEVAGSWGFSPFALVLRLYQGLGALVSGAALWRVRSPGQLALWGAFEGARRWRAWRHDRAAEAPTSGSGYRWPESELRTATIIVEGYAVEAGLTRRIVASGLVEREASQAAEQFVARAADDVQTLVARLARRHTGWFTRARYELALMLVVGALAYRFGRNFFFDSWLAFELGWRDVPASLLGTDFFLGAGLVLALWIALLLWLFNLRLQRGLRAEVGRLAAQWNSATAVPALFASCETYARQCTAYRDRLRLLRARVTALRARVETGSLGHRLAESKS